MNRSKTQDSNAAKVPEPGEGKRGEAGYLSYLLRQAAGAVRLRLDGLGSLVRDLAAQGPEAGKTAA